MAPMQLSMEKSCLLKSLKISCWALLLLTHGLLAQDWEEVRSVELPAAFSCISHDLQGNVYVATIDDQVLKINKEGETLAAFSEPNLGPYSLIEAQITLNPFLFIRDNQQVVFLDRFLANPVIYDLSQWTTNFVALATPGVDRQLWLLENFPLRITKVDRFSGNVLHEILIQIGFEMENLVYFSANQMSLLLVDEVTGIYLFDLFGNLLLHEEVAGAKSAQVIGDQLLYYAANSINQLDIRTAEKQSINLTKPYWDVRNIGEHFLFMEPDQLIWKRLRE